MDPRAGLAPGHGLSPVHGTDRRGGGLDPGPGAGASSDGNGRGCRRDRLLHGQPRRLIGFASRRLRADRRGRWQFDHRAHDNSRRQLVSGAPRFGDRCQHRGQPGGGHADAACDRARDHRPRMARRDALYRGADCCDRSTGYSAGRASAAARSDQQAAAVAGLEVGPALRAPPFWMLASVQILFTVAYNGVYYHLVPFLIDTGYSPQRAAYIFGAKSIFVTAGTIFLGSLADRIGPRRVLAFAMLALCLSLVVLLDAGSPGFGVIAVVLFMIGYGTPTGCTSTLIPMLMVESLGMRRFATLMGIIGFVATVASAL